MPRRLSRFIVTLVASLTLIAIPALGEDNAVQSLMLRGVIVTYDLDASLEFYRDFMGQTVIESRELDAARSQSWLDVSDEAKVVHIIFAGSGEYPGGPVTGGRMSLIAIDDPKRDQPPTVNRRGRHGDVIFPHRVSNLDEIFRRMSEAGVEVLYPPTTSSTGRSRTTMVFDPNGKIIEMFELFNTQ